MPKAATARRWILPAVAAALVAAHGPVLYHVFSLAGLGLAALVGLIVLVLISHLGLFGIPLTALRRRLRSRHTNRNRLAGIIKKSPP